MAQLEFADLRSANVARAKIYKNANGDNAQCDEWTANDWMAATLGELGEAANLIKKVRRGDFHIDWARDEIGEELADVVIYLDLLADHLGIDLEHAVRRKFNKTSSKVGCDVYLDATGRITDQPPHLQTS